MSQLATVGRLFSVEACKDGGMILWFGAGRGQCGAAVNPSLLFFVLKRQENKQSGDYKSEGDAVLNRGGYIMACCVYLSVSRQSGDHAALGFSRINMSFIPKEKLKS